MFWFVDSISWTRSPALVVRVTTTSWSAGSLPPWNNSSIMVRNFCAALAALSLSTSTEGFAPLASSIVRAPTAPVAGTTLFLGGQAGLSTSSPHSRRPRVAASATSVDAGGSGVINMSAGAPKKIVVLGGDGFCGWPTCLHLSDAGWGQLAQHGITCNYCINIQSLFAVFVMEFTQNAVIEICLTKSLSKY